jgi:murein DD-endopeptidase MepM/ murein hydrolase activator NlpD
LKKILTLAIISVLVLSTFLILALHVKANSEITSISAYDYQPEIINEPILMGSEKLIIQDVWPWGSHGTEIVLNERGESYDIIPTTYLATWDLSKYRVVIISSTQWSWSYDNLIAQKDRLANYVAAGGVLVAHACDMGWDGTGHWVSSFLPAGVYHACYAYGGHLTQNPKIVDPTHPIVEGITDAILANWYYSAHGYFTNLPENAKVIIEDHDGHPIYIEYKYGSGTVLATMQTIEWPFIAYWWGLGEPQQRLLRNEIKYAQTLTVAPVKTMIKPVEGYLTSKFGWRNRNGQLEWHNGIDISDVEILGRAIHAPVDGVVVGVGYDDKFGYWIRIYHGDVMRKDGTIGPKVTTGYCHLLELPPLKPNDVVKQGDVIGKVGSTGDSTAPHLHFVIREGTQVVDGKVVALGTEVNPLNYVDYQPAPGVKQLDIRAKSPVDIILTDPDGYVISKTLIEIELTATYLEEDFDRDGDLDVQISIIGPKIGDYLITVVPKPTALPTDMYTLEVLANGVTLFLAEDTQIGAIPSQGYGIEFTETEIIPFIPIAIDIKPDSYPNSINSGAQGFLPVAILTTSSFDASTVDPVTLKLAGVGVQAKGKSENLGVLQDVDVDGDLDLVVHFKIDELGLAEGINKLKLIGYTYEGVLIKGSDSVRVVPPKS